METNEETITRYFPTKQFSEDNPGAYTEGYYIALMLARLVDRLDRIYEQMKLSNGE